MISSKFKNKTKLYVHILPSTDYDWDCIKIDQDKRTLYVRHLFEFHSSLDITPLPKFWTFRTDGIFPNVCQSEVYTVVKNDFMEHVFNGIDTVVMSYGQNNSGKTFVLSGLHNQFELRGVIPRFVSDLFCELEIKKDELSSVIYISVVDVYNNSISDLLSKPITFCDNIKGIRKIKLQTESHCFKLLFLAESRRKIIANRSYNSHSASCVVTFTIRLHPLRSQQSYDIVSKVHFIDLAGVETVQRNELTSFKDHKSQGDANKTKTLLEIFALHCQKYKNHSNKYMEFTSNQRINILTKYLGDSFSPTSLKIFLCHIRPHHEDLMITLSLLKFGKAFKNTRTENPLVHIEDNVKKTIELLSEQIKILEDKLLLEKFLTENYPINMSQGRLTLVRHLVESFLKGELSESELMSMVGDCNLILSIIKTINKETPYKVDTTSQTDKEKELRFSSTDNIETGKPVLKHKSSLVKRHSLITDNEPPLTQPSFQKDKNARKEIKGGKTAGKIQRENKVIMISEEVQVNLIEPFSQLPTIDSRQNHWAKFLICQPEIQAMLDKLMLSIKEKENFLNKSKLNCDNILNILNNKELQLKSLENIKHVENIEMLEKTAKTTIQDEEGGLLSELKVLKRELESTKQKVINDQIEWLDALQNLNDAKQRTEIEFQHFCSLNNLLPLELPTETESDQGQTECQNINAVVEPSNELQESYNVLQKKYLYKM